MAPPYPFDQFVIAGEGLFEAEHVGHRVAAGLLGCEPGCGFECAVNERVAIGGDVGELQALAEGGEVGGVAADFVADAQGVHADFAALAGGFVAVAVEDRASRVLPVALRIASARPMAVPLGASFLKR